MTRETLVVAIVLTRGGRAIIRAFQSELEMNDERRHFTEVNGIAHDWGLKKINKFAPFSAARVSLPSL